MTDQKQSEVKDVPIPESVHEEGVQERSTLTNSPPQHVEAEMRNATSVHSVISSTTPRPGSPIEHSVISSTTPRPDSPIPSDEDPLPEMSPKSFMKNRKMLHIDRDSHKDSHSHCSSIPSLASVRSLRANMSDDGFHHTGHTVILPITSGTTPQPPAPTTEPVNMINRKKTGRFSVSPAQSQSIPMSVSYYKRKTVRTPTKSESSVGPPEPVHDTSREPSMQFKMSDTSLLPDHEKVRDPGIEQQQPLLMDYMEVVSIEPKDPMDVIGDTDMHLDDFDDLLHEVDENQRTITSRYSVNTQDSATYEHAPLQCGNIRFVRDTASASFEPLKKHYLCVGYETDMSSVTEFMAKYWGMRNPNIVLSVISSEEHYKPWKSQRLKDDFQKGIIKAANTTNMWIITNGIDAGIPKIIGDCIKEFNIEQQNSRLMHNSMLSSTEKRQRRPNVIGIVPKDLVPYGVYFDGSEGVQIKNVGQKPSSDIYELNPDHTHFIMVEEDWREAAGGSLRCMMEEQFRYKHGHRKIMRLMSIGSGTDSDTGRAEQRNRVEGKSNLIPVVGLLVQGAPKNIEHVLYYIQNKMPVVVLKGSGGIADMIAYANEELLEKSDSDPDYEENFLKPELIKMIMRMFSAHFEDNELGKFTLRDKIIQCVKQASEGDGDHSCLTVVNIKGWGSSLRDLDKYILQALFKSEKQESTGLQEQLQNDLQLTIDWNRPDLAWEIFQQDFTKVRIDKKMFEKALLLKDREDIIDLFLSQGVKVHKFLNHKKLKLLFEKAEDREFFINVCLESVLGTTVLPNQPLGEHFLSENLNRLIYKLSWVRNFIQPYELSMSSTGLYNVDATVAERKAINSLMIWAVLMNRHGLAKKLWNRCDEPIGVALICSRIYRELSKYMMEQYQRTELENNAQEFGEMALGALAICWRDSSLQAYHMLGKRLPDFNNKSVVEIAHDAGYIHFLAHPCCQKWLTKKFFGHLQVKELDWGFGRLPYWFKILVSVFLIFPMYIWITFIPPSKKKAGQGTDEDSLLEEKDEEEDDDDDDESIHVTKSAMDNLARKQSQRGNLSSTLKTVLAFSLERSKRGVPFHQKLYLLWTAPITKFWTTQVFYFAFLGLFCLATIWPSCGNQILDMMVWLWAMVIEMELVCRVYRKYHKYKTLSLVGNCIDIMLIMVFLVVLLMTRIMQTWVGLSNYLQSRAFMCYGLIYFFYRLLGVYLPISPTLGPMLLRINRMVKHDFVAFVRMFLIFMIVGGVTIQAVIYPHWPLSLELVKRVITRPIYAMFLTQVQDLDGDDACSPSYDNTTDYCYTGSMYTESQQSEALRKLQKCPKSSFSAYVITLQYLLICKLVLVTLLFAMFSLTIGKVDKVASEIWKFQRYSLIADFIERFSLPPPFTIFSFLYLFIKFILKKCQHCTRKISRCCNKKNHLKNMKSTKSRGGMGKVPVDDAIFWKKVAREYTANEDAKVDKESLAAKQGDILVNLQEDLRTHRKSMKRLNDRVIDLERMIQSSRLYLEDIAHKLEKTDVMGITNVKGRFIHVAARQSPYPVTSIARFPVFDKYVPWEVQYDVYDPKTYTLHKDKFPEQEVIYVDEDILEIQRLKEEMKEERVANEDGSNRLSPIPEFEPKWNSVTTYKEKGDRKVVDRRSWITEENQPLRYEIDVLELPQNPMGRTGIRGKGNLWRWGPNHVIKAVVTRWRRKYGPDLNTMSDFLYVEGKRVLEFIAVQKDSYVDGSYALPGDILHGLSNPYSILCQSFMNQVFNEETTGQHKFDQGDMIQFFSQFTSDVAGPVCSVTNLGPHHIDSTAASIGARSAGLTLQPFLSESKPNLHTEMDSQGFGATLLYKGYLDDPRNTDNAWVEAEVWNFHYDVGDIFDLRLVEEMSVKWKEVSPYVKMFGNESVIVQEAARIHDAYH